MWNPFQVPHSSERVQRYELFPNCANISLGTFSSNSRYIYSEKQRSASSEATTVTYVNHNYQSVLFFAKSVKIRFFLVFFTICFSFFIIFA